MSTVVQGLNISDVNAAQCRCMHGGVKPLLSLLYSVHTDAHLTPHQAGSMQRHG